MYFIGLYRNIELSLKLSDFLDHQKPKMPFERPSRGWKRPIAFIALAVGHYRGFGAVQAGDIALYNHGENTCCIVAEAADGPHEITFEDLRETDVQHYRVWLPLFNRAHVVAAIRDWEDWRKKAVEDWLNKVGV